MNNSGLTIKKGSKLLIKSSEQKQNKSKKINNHAMIRYESDNTRIVSITSKGIIQPKKRGKCNIYVYAQNGVYKKIAVRIK